ncbi:MAG TPA: methyltransferase domain-containing protein [Pyrinomonadaceae bacterium]|jgi:Cyclopropane fatty acid synthase and related methyltransferases|nr:methyltransferase domain-containing protein [Pyrinomonadaceae bacterium]
MPSSSDDNLYLRAGIHDLGEFYRTKFVSDEVLDSRYFNPLDRFDMRFARTMWVYDNVCSGSDVLDLGCGAGMLALLKRKEVNLTGVDLSTECALAAKRNGYDASFAASLSQLPFADNSFDYVVTLDVLGHVAFEEKDAVLTEIKRVLRPDGVTMHGIECTDEDGRRRFDEMNEEELRRFVEIDGHVGLEEEQQHAERFRRFFTHVKFEPRYALCLSSEEFIKQNDQYGLPFEDDFVDYLRGLSFKERRAFDMAMGYIFGKISDLHVELPKAGLYVLLKASDAPLGPFYNEHRERKQLFSTAVDESNSCLDRRGDVRFSEDWFEPNVIPPVARWMGKQGRITFKTSKLRKISFDLTTHLPNLKTEPVQIDLLINGELLAAWSLFRQGWLTVEVFVPQNISGQDDLFELELTASRTWQPRVSMEQDRDDREISIAVCNIQIG